MNEMVAQWAEVALQEKPLRDRYETAKRAYEQQLELIEKARRKLTGVGANIQERFVRVAASGQTVVIQLTWKSGTEDRRREDRIDARIVEIE